MKQASSSSDNEYFPEFSPDSQYLVFGHDVTQGYSLGGYWVIPAEGDKVWVGKEKTTVALPIMYNDNGRPIKAGSGYVNWRN